MLTTTNAAGILTPEQVGALVVQPALAASVAATVSTVVQTGSHEYRVPIVVSDPVAQWVSEGAEINPSDASLDELLVVPKKLAGLTIISRELADDSDPSAATAVGDGLARDLARLLDAAFFGSLAAPAPAGLGTLAGVATVAAGTAYANFDSFAEALSLAETAGAGVDNWVTSPATALTLSKIREATGSNRLLLGSDPSEPTRRQILGVPLLVSPAVAPGVVWGLPLDRTLLVLREDTDVQIDSSAFFTSDRIAVRATLRAAFGFPHAAAVVRIKTGA